MSDDEVLERHAVERIVRRASSMAGTAPIDAGAGGISAGALVAAATEVGLAESVIRQSIAIERLGPLPARSLGDRLLGARVVVVDEQLVASPQAALERIDSWLVQGHHLRRDRLRAGHGSWSRRSGVVGVAVRAVRGATGEGQLGELDQVTAVAHEAGAGSCVVRVSADRSRRRSLRAGSSTAVAVVGSAGVAVAAVAAGPVLVVATPVPIAVGAWVAARGRRKSARVARELQRMVDLVRDGASPTPLRVDVVRRMRGRTSRDLQTDHG